MAGEAEGTSMLQSQDRTDWRCGPQHSLLLLPSEVGMQSPPPAGPGCPAETAGPPSPQSGLPSAGQGGRGGGCHCQIRFCQARLISQSTQQKPFRRQAAATIVLRPPQMYSTQPAKGKKMPIEVFRFERTFFCFLTEQRCGAAGCLWLKNLFLHYCRVGSLHKLR